MQRTSVRRASSGGPVRRTEARKKLSMYNEFPGEELSLDEFEEFVCDRLRVLRHIDALRARGLNGVEFRRKVDEALNRYLPMRSYEGAEDDRRKDLLSHWLLRLAHCKTEERRLWFLNQECALFRHRLEELSAKDLHLFMEENGLRYDVVSDQEKQRLRDSLTPLLGRNGVGASTIFERTQFYRVPFTQALQEVRRRNVFLSMGQAYVPAERFVGIVAARFRMSLSRSMAIGAASFGFAAADPRIGPVLSHIDKQYVGKNYNAAAQRSGKGIVPEMIDDLAERSMPLCMRHQHKTLRSKHKLLHDSRRQYGLFLKGAGLSLEDAHRFFEREFTKIISPAEFKKKYTYNIRHQYGKEGKRTDYSPLTCMQIIQGSPPMPGQAHGCPYRHWGEPQLSALLGQMRITGQDRESILASARNQHFQVACQKHFEVAHRDILKEHGLPESEVGNHPNGFLAASMELHEKVAAKAKKPKAEPAAPPAAAAAATATATA